MKTSQRSSTRPTPTLKGLGELVTYVPYLLGFHPSDSIVVLGNGRGGVGPVARADVVDQPLGQRAVTERMLTQMTRAAPEWFEVLLFSDSVVGRDLLRGVGAALRQTVGPVHHLVVVRPQPETASRWQLAECRCGLRCTTRWGEAPAPDRVPMIADRVLEGQMPAPSRAALEGSVQPRPLVAQAVLAADRRPPDLDRYAQSLLRVLDVDDRAVAVAQLPVPVLRDVLDALTEPTVRDHLLGWLVPDAMGPLTVRPELSEALRRAGGRPWPRPGDPGAALRLQERLRGLLTCAPDRLAAAPATVLAYWCWAHGGGALASIALERALQVDPRYRLAQLLRQVLEHGLSPDQLAGYDSASG